MYGFKDGNFESLQKCYSTLFRTLNSGDLPHNEMYKADPMLAGTTATIFIFVVVFFSQYFIVGIIIQTYTQFNQELHYLMVRAMVSILWNDF